MWNTFGCWLQAEINKETHEKGTHKRRNTKKANKNKEHKIEKKTTKGKKKEEMEMQKIK